MNAQNNLNPEWKESQSTNFVLENEQRLVEWKVNELINLKEAWLIWDRDFSQEILSVINLTQDEQNTMALARMFWTWDKALNLILKERWVENQGKTRWAKIHHLNQTQTSSYSIAA